MIISRLIETKQTAPHWQTVIEIDANADGNRPIPLESTRTTAHRIICQVKVFL